MKLGLIGDIHADSRALETALRHLDDLGVDQLLCTGDLIGYGWQADAVVDRVRKLAIPCVRGNHDRWALERRQVIGPRGWKPAELDDATWEFLETLPAALSMDRRRRRRSRSTTAPRPATPNSSRRTARSPIPSRNSGTGAMPR